MKGVIFTGKGQTIIELAVFGSIILIILGVLISYIQRQNDQQYAQMKAFRFALHKAAQGPVGFEGNIFEADPESLLDLILPGKGAAVQYTVLENRRYADLSSEFRKGSPSSVSASSSVFWAIPFVGNSADSLTVIKVNEDSPIVVNNNGPLGIFGTILEQLGLDDSISLSMETGEIETNTDTLFDEAIRKQEGQSTITNTRQSNLTDTVNTKIKYKVKMGFPEFFEDMGDIGEILDTAITVNEGTLAELNQGAYVEDGQYKYSSAALGTRVERARQWETDF